MAGLKVDGSLDENVEATKDAARALEQAGYDGMWVGETKHDPFLQCLHAADATDRVSVGTSIAIAFGRTPMTVAGTAFDLARYSRGRFILGLGSQIKPHIERRFSMPWSHPAPRMREFVLALRAIWSAWQDGTKLDFRGDFYTHTLMTPFFSPPPHDFGPPPVFLAGVGELMTEVVGEVADGFFVHPFSTARYFDEVTRPALERGRATSGRAMDGFEVSAPTFVTVGRDEQEMQVAATATKGQIAFYASTPAYRGVLDVHGWGELQPELTGLSKEGRWAEMGDLVSDEMLRAFSVVGTPEEVGPALRTRLANRATRTSLVAPYQVDPAIWPTVLDALR